MIHQHKAKEMEWLAMEEKLWLALECRGKQVKRLAQLLNHSEARNVELTNLLFELCQQDRVARQLANSALLQRTNSAVLMKSSGSATSGLESRLAAVAAAAGSSGVVSQLPIPAQSRGVQPFTRSGSAVKFARKSTSRSSSGRRQATAQAAAGPTNTSLFGTPSQTPLPATTTTTATTNNTLLGSKGSTGSGSTPKFGSRPKGSVLSSGGAAAVPPVRRVVRRVNGVPTADSTLNSNVVLAADMGETSMNPNAFVRTASGAMPAKRAKPRLVVPPPLPRVATLGSLAQTRQVELSGGGYAGRGLVARVPATASQQPPMKLNVSGKGSNFMRELAEAAAAPSPKKRSQVGQKMPATPPAEEQDGGEVQA